MGKKQKKKENPIKLITQLLIALGTFLAGLAKLIEVLK